MTGCLVRTRNILIRTPPGVVMNATTAELVDGVNARYDALQSLTATVDINATVGHNDTGEAKDYPTSRGYILIRRPEMLRVFGLLPVIRTTAFDMVSDGSTFNLYIPPESKAFTGGMTVETPSKNVLENLRPPMFVDSLLIKRIGPDELVSLTSDTRILDTNRKSHHVVEEPDYNLGTYREKPGSNQLVPLRVIHISRTTLLPYQLDVYDADGKIETQTMYENYALYGTLKFPSKVTINRPLQNLTLTLNIVKLDSNQQLDDDEFKLDIPKGTPVKNLK